LKPDSRHPEGEIHLNTTRALLAIAVLLTGCATSPPVQNTSPSDSKSDQIEDGFSTESNSVGNASDALTSTENQTATEADYYTGTGVFINSPEDPRSLPKQLPGKEAMLNFADADIREVVKVVIGNLLGESYLIDPTVKGRINLHTAGPIKREDLLPTLETMLRMNGAAIVWEQGLYKVLPMALLKGSMTPRLGGGTAPLIDGYHVQISPLDYIAAREMKKILEPYVSDAGSVRTDEMRNLMVLTGTQRELQHMQETIDLFDVDWLAGMSVGLFTLKNVDVKTAATDLQVLFSEESMTPIAGLIKMVPIERLNAMLVVTPQPEYLAQAQTWIERMDRNSGASGGTRLFVYPVKNGQAEHLAILLNDVFSGSDASQSSQVLGGGLAPGLLPTEIKSTGSSASSTTASKVDSKTGGVSKDIRVIADIDNNSLLILASPEDYRKIESAIEKLDVIPRQVLIDVTIAEVQLTGDLIYGLEWQFSNGSGSQTGQLDMGPSGIAALTPGFSYLWQDGDEVNAALNLLAEDSRVNVISSPHVMVTDNQKAEINVGDQVPTTSQTQSVSGSAVGIISSVTYIDTGVLLSVTPRINAGGLVTMEIEQEVSTAATTTTSSIDSPTISTRSVRTTVVVKSGETMVMGGLITENESQATSGIPYLSKIPLVGGLFGTQGFGSTRTELIILITPRMVADTEQSRAVTNEFRRKVGGLQEILEKANM
jgi:general secretion pathway protein D